MNIYCRGCGQPFAATVETIVDATDDTDAKLRLLSGQLNANPCPNCGTVNMVAAPLVYHDGGRELLITHIPMELNLSKDNQEKAIGDLMRQLMNTIPQEKRKGYFLRPASALTMQGLVEQILQADGVTPEMMAQQRARIDLIQKFVEAPQHQLDALVKTHDAALDSQFFQTMTLLAQRMAQSGQLQAAQQIIMRQAEIAELSTFGQQLVQVQQAQEAVVREVAEIIEALGENATRDDFVKLAVQFARDDARLEALVGLVRPVFDYQLFQDLTVIISKAPATERDALESLRDKLLELTAMIDEQAQAALQQAVAFLQQLVTSPDPDELIRANADLIDDAFMTVLDANLQEAQRRGDQNAMLRLRDVQSRVMAVLQQTMQPELRFLNDLLSMDDDQAVAQAIAQHAKQFGPQLLDMLDAVEQVLASRGDQEMMSKLAFMRVAIRQAVG
jgi:hypothetical protein